MSQVQLAPAAAPTECAEHAPELAVVHRHSLPRTAYLAVTCYTPALTAKTERSSARPAHPESAGMLRSAQDRWCERRSRVARLAPDSVPRGRSNPGAGMTGDSRMPNQQVVPRPVRPLDERVSTFGGRPEKPYDR